MTWQTKPMKDINDYLSKEEFEAIYNKLKSNRDKAVVYLLYKTGRRVSEILGDKQTNCEGLKVKDINFRDKMINFTILKRKPLKERGLSRAERIEKRKLIEPQKESLPVNSQALKGLMPFCVGKGFDDKVFKMTRQRLHSIFKEAAKDAGIERRIHLHQLRHSFAIETARKCANPAELEKLRELLGHTDINITKTYLKFSPKSDTRRLIE